MSVPTYKSQTIPVLSLRPDWGREVAPGLQYATTISEALDTTEERQGRQPRPLYTLTYSTLALSAAETAYLRRILQTVEDLPVACPLWPFACKLTALAAAGAAALTVDDSSDCLFGVFHEYALLWSDCETWEVVELDAVGETALTLLAALAQDYPIGAWLMPLAYGHVPRAGIEQLTDEHGVWECKFEERFLRLHDQSVPEDEPA